MWICGVHWKTQNFKRKTTNKYNLLNLIKQQSKIRELNVKVEFV